MLGNDLSSRRAPQVAVLRRSAVKGRGFSILVSIFPLVRAPWAEVRDSGGGNRLVRLSSPYRALLNARARGIRLFPDIAYGRGGSVLMRNGAKPYVPARNPCSFVSHGRRRVLSYPSYRTRRNPKASNLQSPDIVLRLFTCLAFPFTLLRSFAVAAPDAGSASRQFLSGSFHLSAGSSARNVRPFHPSPPQ